MDDIPQIVAHHYRMAMRQFAPPTDQQTQDFVDWVAQDHSWYKHLPLLPPGKLFVCFLHPHAHQLPHMSVNGAAWKNIMASHKADEDDEVRHLTTDEWHARFGLWQYWQAHYTLKPKVCADIARWYAPVGEPDLIWLPEEVLALGTVEVRGTINRFIHGVPFLKYHYEAEREKYGLLPVNEDRQQQLVSLLHALHQVVAWLYG